MAKLMELAAQVMAMVPSIESASVGYPDAAARLRDELGLVGLRLVAAQAGSHDARAMITSADDIIASRVAHTGELDSVHAQSWPRTRLHLDGNEAAALWLLVGCEVSPLVRALAMMVGDAIGVPWRDDIAPELVRHVIYGPIATAAAWRALGSHGRLARLGLVENAGARNTIRASSRAVALLLGDTSLDPVVAAIASIAAPIAAADLLLGDGVMNALRDAVNSPCPQFVVATGARGSGRRSALVAAVQATGRRALLVDARRIAADSQTATAQLTAVATEAQALALQPVIVELDVLAGAERIELVRQLLVPALAWPVLATASTSWTAARDTAIIALPVLDEAHRITMWQRALPEAPLAFVAPLAAMYALPPGAIARAAQLAIDAMNPYYALTSDEVRVAIDRVLDERLDGLATRVRITQSWDDLVLADEQLESIDELMARVRHRRQVHETWGFADKVGRGLGVAALFSGPPGTGKTMIAGLIARELGLPLYQVDLSKLVSKWVGETEQRLGELFDAAEASHAILLFDEADSLFGKRGEVKAANDRYANLEVNYLLQRLEQFTGICILTTNHDSAIDEAFRRRLALHVRLAIPARGERARLWMALLPAAAAVANDVDADALAIRFEMSGGYIRNAVLRSAFLAAAANSPISHGLLERAAIVEYEAMGKIVA